MPSRSRAPAPMGPIKKAAGIVLMCAASGMIGAALTRSIGGITYTMSYADFLSIMLTGVSVLLTALAIMLALAGVIGWSSIEKKVEDGVRGNVDNFLSKGFESGGQWDRLIEKMVKKTVDEKTTVAMNKISSEVYLGIEEEGQGEGDQDDGSSANQEANSSGNEE